MAFHVLFVTLCSLLDLFLSVIFPADYGIMHAMFIPAAGLIAMMLCVRRMSYRETVSFTVVYGLLWGCFFPNVIWLYAIVFLVVALLVKVWSINLTDSFLELLVLALLTIFVKELLVYWYLRIADVTTLSLFNWLSRVLFVTIMANIPLSCLVILGNRLKIELMLRQEKERTRKERITWEELK